MIDPGLLKERLFKHYSDLTCLIAANDLIIDIGPALDDLKGKPYLELIHPEDIHRTISLLARARKGEDVGLENRLLTSEGYRWLDCFVVLGKDGVLTLLARDVSNRRRSVEHFLETVLDNIPDMIFVKEAKELRFVRFNKAGQVLLGQDLAGLIGKNDFDVFPEDQAEFFTEKDRAVLQERQVIDIPEEPIETPQGTRILHTKKIPVYDAEGQPLYLMGISEDITEKKMAQDARLRMFEEQVARQEVEKNLQARDEFISIASHELKSPLSSLLLEAQLFRRYLKKDHPIAKTPERIERLIDMTEKQVLRLERLVNDMLDVSRIRTGKLTMEFTSHNLVEIIPDVLARMSEQFAAAVSGPPRFVSDPVALPAHVDRLRLEQVLVNLLTNAIRYGEGSSIEVRLKSDGVHALISVSDKGIGIASENLKKIFDRFERAVDPSEVSGLGLGLFIARLIAEAHHGRIWVESEIGQGSTFYLELPLVH